MILKYLPIEPSHALDIFGSRHPSKELKSRIKEEASYIEDGQGTQKTQEFYVCEDVNHRQNKDYDDGHKDSWPIVVKHVN